MKEEEIKRIVQNSKLETSADFTDRLMLKIEEKEAKRKTALNRIFVLVLSGLCALSIAISYLLFTNFGSTFIFSPFKLKISGTPVFLVITVFLLFAINYWLRLRHNYKNLEKVY